VNGTIGRMHWMAGLAAAAALASACSGSHSGRLSVAAKAAGAAPAQGAAPGLDVGQGITLTRVRVAVQRIGLEGTAGETGGSAGMDSVAPRDQGGGGSDGSDQGGGDAGEVKVGPFAVDLGGADLAGGVHPFFDGDVPAASYRELKIVVGPVAPDAPGLSQALADMSGQSVIVEGTIDGTAFTFQSALQSEQKRETAIDVAGDGSSKNVTLTIDPTGWFVGMGGRLDPNAAADRAAMEGQADEPGP